MRKLEIIQRLLDERHITAQEALVLMEKDYVYYPYHPDYPVCPNWPVTVYETRDTTGQLIVNTN